MKILLDPDGEILSELKQRKKDKIITEEELKLFYSLRHNAYMHKYNNSDKGRAVLRKNKLLYMEQTGRKCSDATIKKFEITEEEIKNCLKSYYK